MTPVEIKRRCLEAAAQKDSALRHCARVCMEMDEVVRDLQTQCPHETVTREVGQYWHVRHCDDCGAEVE